MNCSKKPLLEQLRSDAQPQAHRYICNNLKSVGLLAQSPEEDNKQLFTRYKQINEYQMIAMMFKTRIKVYFRKDFQPTGLFLQMSEILKVNKLLDLDIFQLYDLFQGNNKFIIQQNTLLIPFQFGEFKKQLKLQLIERPISIEQQYALQYELNQELMYHNDDCYCLNRDLYYRCKKCQLYVTRDPRVGQSQQGNSSKTSHLQAYSRRKRNIESLSRMPSKTCPKCHTKFSEKDQTEK